MKNKLYYCRYWEHELYSDYELCVSDVVYSDDKKMAQIHVIIMKNGEVVRGIASSMLREFESFLREYIRQEFGKRSGLRESEEVKIWYYNVDNRPINPNDIPLRIAITFVNSTENISTTEYNDIRRSIYDYLQKFLEVQDGII